MHQYWKNQESCHRDASSSCWRWVDLLAAHKYHLGLGLVFTSANHFHLSTLRRQLSNTRALFKWNILTPFCTAGLCWPTLLQNSQNEFKMSGFPPDFDCYNQRLSNCWANCKTDGLPSGPTNANGLPNGPTWTCWVLYLSINISFKQSYFLSNNDFSITVTAWEIPFSFFSVLWVI